MLDVGLTATRKTISFPFEMPPLMPPAWFVAVRPDTSRIASFITLPRMRAAAKPAPNSIPLTAGTANTAWLISDSSESKNGSPSPGGTPEARHSIRPPIESPSAARLLDDRVDIRRAAGLDEARVHLGGGDQLLRDDAGRHERHGQAAREVAAAARVVESAGPEPAVQSACPGRGVCARSS